MKEIIDYSPWFKEKTFPCPICGEHKEIRITDKGKPYLVCDPCGTQLFVRNLHGITKLREKTSFWRI